MKHHIKAVDRLLGNAHLHRERDGVYSALARTVLGGLVRPVILVDWADSALAHKQVILKAAVPVKGRAISIYEEAHPMRRYNNARAHGQFLQRLHAVLPQGYRPIIVTDAGFRGPWFRDDVGSWVGLGRTYPKPNQILATGNRALVLHPFAVPTGHAARAPHRLEMPVSPPPILVPAVSGA